MADKIKSSNFEKESGGPDLVICPECEELVDISHAEPIPLTDPRYKEGATNLLCPDCDGLLD